MNESIERRLAKLDALEAGGVDKWEWYGESLKEWFKENHKHEVADDFINSLNDIMVEADVDEPAGVGCGHAINYDEQAIRKLFLLFADKLEEEDG